jgi:hypothetical protein
MPTQHPEVSVLIVSYNTRELLRGCLESLRRVHDEVNLEIIVVDNASSDDTAAMIRSGFETVTLIESSENIGFASGINLARQSATGDLLLILNPDCLVPRYSIQKLRDFLVESPARAIAGARITTADGLDLPSEFSIPTLFREFWNFLPELKSCILKWLPVNPSEGSRDHSGLPRKVRSISGAAFMIRAEHFDQAGGMDGNFFLYHEELDLCTRIDQLGLEVWTLPEAQIIHFDAQASGYSTKKLARSPLLEWRVMGMDRLWQKHRTPAEHACWRKLARCLLKLRIGLLKTKKPFSNHEAKRQIRERITELAALADKLR